MKTKDAIEVLETEIYFCKKGLEGYDINSQIDEIKRAKELTIEYKQIIPLLQQGEKYKKMYLSSANLCEELKKELAEKESIK